MQVTIFFALLLFLSAQLLFCNDFQTPGGNTVTTLKIRQLGYQAVERVEFVGLSLCNTLMRLRKASFHDNVQYILSLLSLVLLFYPKLFVLQNISPCIQF